MDFQNPTVTDKLILEPFDYVNTNSGKGIRQHLIKAFNFWLHISPEKVTQLSEIIEMLHNASLIIDDIEDGSDRRRGKPAAHMLFGTPLSINSANYAYFLALHKALQLNHPSVPKIYTDQMLELHRGQGLDIYWRCSFKCPTESEYNDMVIKKTGGLFGMAVNLMQLFSTNKCDFKKLLDAIGLWFQIRDDYANLVDVSYQESKDFADDLTEGKFSFPVVHAINTFPNDNQVISILRQRTTDLVVKQYCVRHLFDLGSLDYTAKTLIKLENTCRSITEQFGGNASLCRFFDTYSKLYRTASGDVINQAPYFLEKPRSKETSVNLSDDYSQLSN